MARSDLLKRLLAAYSRGDDREFRAVASAIVDDERRKNHVLLANELEHALYRDGRPGAESPLTLRPIPKGRDERPLLSLVKPRFDFDDLVLAAPLRDELFGIVHENRSRSVLTSHSLRPRQGLLFVGTSGTGKSATAHAVAAELSLPVAIVSIASLTSSFLGETARHIESVMRFAEVTPCVLLFDEFDALGGERSGTTDHAEFRRVVATVLQMFDERPGESVLVATSNHAHLLDAALWRRFDEVITFDNLDRDGRAALIQLRLRAVPNDLDAGPWADQLADASPAEVELVCLHALRLRALEGSYELDDSHLARALERLGVRQQVMRSLRDHPPDR